MEQTVTWMIASLRRNGTLPPGLQPGAGLAQIFQRPLLEAVQIDRYAPAAVAAKLPANTPVSAGTSAVEPGPAGEASTPAITVRSTIA